MSHAEKTESYDVIIVGGGPAGSTAASFMAVEGLRVLLLDKARFPRDKVCGDAISGKSVEVLKELGVVERVMAAGSQDSWGITFGGPAGHLVPVPFTADRTRPVPPTFVCRREVFDQILFERAASVVEVREETELTGLLREGDRVVGVRVRSRGKKGTESIRAPLVVGADGAYSVVVRELGMVQLDQDHYAAAVRAYYEGCTGFHEHAFMEIHFLDECRPGYFWIFPLGDGRANVGVGMLSRTIKKKRLRLKEVLDACLAQPRFRDRFREARRVGPVKGWGLPLGSKPRPMAGDGWLLLGDAASLVDPFSGEGIGNAMVGARAAARWARKARNAGDFSATFLQGFEREMLDMLREELRVSRAMQRLTGWSTLLDFVLRKASRSPEVAHVLSCMFDDEQQRRRLLTPLFYLRLLAA